MNREPHRRIVPAADPARVRRRTAAARGIVLGALLLASAAAGAEPASESKGPPATGSIIIGAGIDGTTGNIHFELRSDFDNTDFRFETSGRRDFDDVPVGPYRFLAFGPGNTRLGTLACDDESSATPSTIDRFLQAVTVNLDPGEVVRCDWSYDVTAVRALGCGGGDDGDFTAHLRGAVPGLAVVSYVCLPAGDVDTPYGDLLFSDDGATAWFLSESEEEGSRVAMAPVFRDQHGDVTGFGVFQRAFADPFADTGLAAAPGGDALFFRTTVNSALGQVTQRRASDGAIERTDIEAYDSEYGGLAFVPPGFGEAGNLLTASYDETTIWLHPVSDDGDGTYTIGMATEVLQTHAALGDIEYAPPGRFEGTLLAVDYGDRTNSLFALPVDPVTGLPAAAGTPETIAFGEGGPWGAAVDPLTGNLWVISYDEAALTQLRYSETVFRDGLEPPAPGTEFRECEACPTMVTVPAGTFAMGDSAGLGPANELPVHTVTVPEFAIGVTEVTFAQWEACVAAEACDDAALEAAGGDQGWGRDERPLIQVSWEEAQDYVAWLSEITGATYRLPTEAEWEYAARAGTTAPYWTGEEAPRPCATGAPDGANYGRCRPTEARTDPVGSYGPNAFGLHDVSGNVWEWAQDCGIRSYDGAPTDGSAWVVEDCGVVIARGGSWSNGAGDLRTARRIFPSPLQRTNDIGFRVARSP